MKKTNKKQTETELPKIVVHRFSHTPEAAFEEGEILHGFNPEALGGDDYETPRAKRLYKKLGAEISDYEYQLGALPDGRWALVGLSVEGHSFAVEQ